ncbi:hypothetical protein F5051DRAFT_462723 [Lentinula edodes]|nr:hypothetical protein F5051DRAFT_462723 [Lentinula edodes]
MSFCEDCIKGVKHDGTPEGKWETINGQKDKLPNAQLLVDGFAKNGFKVLATDPPIARPLLDKVIAALKGQGVTAFAASGYCYGGRLVFDLAFENITSASIANHSSHLKSPDDLEVFPSTRPLPAHQSQADEGKFTPGYKREYFDGCTHGFAVRGDLSIPQVKAGKEGAFKAVEWLYKYGFGPEGKASK